MEMKNYRVWVKLKVGTRTYRNVKPNAAGIAFVAGIQGFCYAYWYDKETDDQVGYQDKHGLSCSQLSVVRSGGQNAFSR